MEQLAGTAIVSFAGAQLFNYNRGNFRYDSQLRFERFQSQREYAIQQTNQYRNDIRKLTELTVKKMSSYHMTGCLIIAVNIALFCAGRLGLHGASPPGWIMGLFLTNNAASLGFLATAVWLALHASQRASAASTHLLTRKVRVPVPTKKQLDMTRKLSSDFEQQKWSDIFRFPYLMKGGDTVPDLEVDDLRTNQGSRRRSSSAPAGRRAEKGGPAWYREEWDQDKRLKNSDAGIHQVPEHFKLYAEVQKEWYQQECWARVCLFYGVLHFLHALAYYGLGHIFVELRSVWTALVTSGMLMVGHALLMSFDIRPHMKFNEMLPNFEYIGSLAIIPAFIAMSLEFRVTFDATAVNMGWILILLAYFMQIVYVLRLLEVVGPDRNYSVTETIGGAWWPRAWQFPSAFQHVMFLVAPPDHLKPGQVDLLRETVEGTDGTIGDQMRGVDNEQAVAVLSDWLQHYFTWWFERVSEASDYVSQEGKEEVEALRRDFVSAKNSNDAGRLRSVALSLKDAIYSHTNNVIESPDETLGADAGGGGPDFNYAPNSSAPLYSRVKMVEPWRIASTLLIAILIGWSIMVIGIIIEAFMGEQVFLTAPHWARPPMTRPSRTTWELGAPLGGNDPAGARDWLPENMEFYMEEKCKGGDEAVALGVSVPDHSGNDRFQNGDSCNNHWRRLQGHKLWGTRKQHKPPKHLAPPSKREELLGSLTDLLSTLPSLDEASGLLNRDPSKDEAEALRNALAEFTPSKHSRPDAMTAKLAAPLFKTVARETTWPGFFDPRVLACGPQADGQSNVAAITPRGIGATVSVGGDGPAAAETFVLAGLANLPPLIGASWLDDGLVLATRGGDIVSCPGSRPQSGGRWACAPLEGVAGTMPVAEAETLLSASASWMDVSGERQLFVAFVTEAQPDVVGIFVLLDGGGSDASWLPFGDMTPPREGGRTGRVSVSFVGATDILVATEDGAMLQRSLSDGSLVASVPASAPWRTAIAASTTPSTVWWQGICAAAGDMGTDFIQLSLQQTHVRSWKPDLGLMRLGNASTTV